MANPGLGRSYKYKRARGYRMRSLFGVSEWIWGQPVFRFYLGSGSPTKCPLGRHSSRRLRVRRSGTAFGFDMP